jgi:hypothetical protein
MREKAGQSILDWRFLIFDWGKAAAVTGDLNVAAGRSPALREMGIAQVGPAVHLRHAGCRYVRSLTHARGKWHGRRCLSNLEEKKGVV